MGICATSQQAGGRANGLGARPARWIGAADAQLWQLSNVDAGYNTEDIFTFRIAASRPDLNDRALMSRFQYAFMDRLKALPGVESVSQPEHHHSQDHGQRRGGAQATAFPLANLLLSPRFLEFRGSRQNSAPRAHVCRCGLCLGGLRLSEKPSTQTQLAIDG